MFVFTDSHGDEGALRDPLATESILGLGFELQPLWGARIERVHRTAATEPHVIDGKSGHALLEQLDKRPHHAGSNDPSCS